MPELAHALCIGTLPRYHALSAFISHLPLFKYGLFFGIETRKRSVHSSLDPVADVKAVVTLGLQDLSPLAL